MTAPLPNRVRGGFWELTQVPEHEITWDPEYRRGLFGITAGIAGVIPS